jgi:hypothetical protein
MSEKRFFDVLLVSQNGQYANFSVKLEISISLLFENLIAGELNYA